MISRAWLLVLGIGFLPGCGQHRAGILDTGILADQMARATRAPEPESPYHIVPVVAAGKGDPDPIPDTQARPSAVTAAESEDQGTGVVPPAGSPLIQPPPVSPPPSITISTNTVVSADKPELPLLAALRCYCEERPFEALEQLKTIATPQREVLVVLLPLLARLGAASSQTGHTEEILGPLECLTQSLKLRAGLSIEKLSFCRSVERFGVYNPLPAGHVFQAGSEGRPGDMVQLYIELKNFLCQRNGSEYETALACTLVIRDGQDHIVFRQDRDPQIERSRSPRQDCYLRCHFYVPPRLPVGDYTLWILVKDVTGQSGEAASAQRVARRSLDFRVRSQSTTSLGNSLNDD